MNSVRKKFTTRKREKHTSNYEAKCGKHYYRLICDVPNLKKIRRGNQNEDDVEGLRTYKYGRKGYKK